MNVEPSVAPSPTAAPPSRKRILILDDEQAIQRLLKLVLESEGYEVVTTDDGRLALDILRTQPIDLIIQDLRMPKMDGLQFLRQLKDQNPELPSIVLTAYGTLETAVEAMRLGAYTHINKPFDTEEIRLTVSRALERIELRKKNPRSLVPFLDIIGNTASMSDISRLIEMAAPTDSTILISGESGTGKELVARAIHYNSLRADQAFIPVNCGAFTETLLESELFGHVRGAFTNAINNHEGVFERADRGTLFLDEVGEMSLTTQVKLLRVLETRTFKPVGGSKDMKVDVRFITATNRNLSTMVAEGQFREDLFYRLNVIPVQLPPLRERRDDIPLLAGHFLASCVKKTNKQIKAFDDAAIEKLYAHPWPGNVRELQNTIERAVALARGERITAAEITLPMSGGGMSGAYRPLHTPAMPAQQPMFRPQQPQRPQQPVMQDSFARNFNAGLAANNPPVPLVPQFDPYITPAMPSSGVRGSGMMPQQPFAPQQTHPYPQGQAPGMESGVYPYPGYAPVNAPVSVPAPLAQVTLPAEGMDLEKFLLEQERTLIIQALERTNWNLTDAAKILCMTFRSIRYRVAKLAIERPGKGEFTEG
ncbi:MAG TPA: sigma 54-interacting transcriptional regulator [Planctomycetota bacterium]|nr:sigma 54-interacting transcriptional regulator [Planctomycetota bacterium]